MLSLLWLISGAVCAGSRAGSGESAFTEEALATFAKQVERYAARYRARVFILARQGVPEDELPEGVKFTHTALAVYSTISTTDGRQLKGYAIHNLYQSAEGAGTSHLALDYPVDFFQSVPVLKAGVLIPSDAVQDKVLQVVQSGQAARLHNPHYSILSNPFNSQFQNCTELTLDILFSALYSTDNRAQIKANERAYFKPQSIPLSATERWFGSMVREDFTLADHSGPVQTVTFASLRRFLADYGLLAQSAVITPESVVRLP